MWVVHAIPPPQGWVFPNGYFPRTFALKKSAQERADEAKRAGGLDVRVEKVK